MNSSLTSLVNDVYTLTNRPDLVGETTLAVRNATLKAHKLDFFPKDLFETGVQFDFPLAQQILEYKNVVPRFRALKYIRKYAPDAVNPNLNTPGKFLEILTPDNLMDTYGIHKEDICYIAGLQIQIRTVEANQYFLMGCYVSPDVTVDNYYSWIAQEQPAAITYAAAATVFKAIGYDEQNATYQKLVQEEYQQLLIGDIGAVGY